MNRKNSVAAPPRIIISGGGTGGHIVPAISIANAVRERWPDADILFVGAENRMEMERVPAAGYRIIGLPVAGFNRRSILKNIPVAIRLLQSMRRARLIVRDFKPDIAVGVGGYASGPTLRAASRMGVLTLLQEQNSYAGVTNKMLAKNASKICVAYHGMEKFFPKERIVLTGNPCRQDLVVSEENRTAGYDFFGIDPTKKTILMVGGSLGARTLNNSIVAAFPKLSRAGDVQVIWQCGSYYYREMQRLQQEGRIPANVHLTDFVSRMDYAYSVADLVISRAGAGSISEFCLLGKAVILVPSPNVAEDHQTKNARTLVDRGAALYVRDADAETELINKAIETVNRPDLLKSLSENIHQLAFTDAANKIAQEVIRIAVKHKNAGR